MFFRQMIQAELRAAKFKVSQAIDAKQARQIISAGEVDVMLLDYLLPDGTGADVWRFTREVNPRLASRTVMITGALEESDRRELEQLTGAPVMAKPFEPELLVHLLDRLAKGLD